ARAHALFVECGVARRAVQLELIEARARGHDIDRAGGRVLAEQRALRAAQNLDAIDIVEVEERAGRATDHDAVDYGRHGGLHAIGKVERANAADRETLPARIQRIG